MKKAILVLVVLGAMANVASAQKLGVMDLHKALNETNQGKKAKARLKTSFEDKQKQLDAKGRELKQLNDDLEKQRAILKPEALAAKERELEQRYLALQDTYMKLQQDFGKQEAQLTKEIFLAAKKIIDEIAARDGYTMIFEKTESSVLYAGKGLEITDEVIRRMNEGSPSKKDK